MAVADGEVSVAELRVALENVVTCMESSGVVIRSSGLIEKESGAVETELAYDAPDEDDFDRLDEIERGCKGEHLDFVFGKFSNDNVPSRDDQEALAERVVVCLDGLGLSLPPGVEPGVFVGQIQQSNPGEFGECMGQAQDG